MHESRAIVAGDLQLGRVNFGQSHFDAEDEGWTLLEGSDLRTYRKLVEFAQVFSQVPHVHLGLSSIDTVNPANPRISVDAVNVTTVGFELEVVTWSDGAVWGGSVNWIAIPR